MTLEQAEMLLDYVRLTYKRGPAALRRLGNHELVVIVDGYVCWQPEDFYQFCQQKEMQAIRARSDVPSSG